MNLNDLFTEEKVRLDPKCWTGKKIGNPKTKMKGGTRVNNCVPAESVNEMNKSQTPPGRDGSNDSDAGKKEYTAKATTPKKVAQDGEKILNKELNKKQGVAEGLDEAVGGNYLYHATSSDINVLKNIISNGLITNDSNQERTGSKLRALSFTRNWRYALTSTDDDNQGTTGIANGVIFVVDQSILKQKNKMQSVDRPADIINEFKAVLAALPTAERVNDLFQLMDGSVTPAQLAALSQIAGSSTPIMNGRQFILAVAKPYLADKTNQQALANAQSKIKQAISYFVKTSAGKSIASAGGSTGSEYEEVILTPLNYVPFKDLGVVGYMINPTVDPANQQAIRNLFAKVGVNEMPIPNSTRPGKGMAEGASSIEQKIIKLYKQGLSDDEIASRLKIDSDDVKSVLDDYEWVADTTGEEKGVAEGEKKGLYYYVNKRKKAGTSRDASSPKAPSAQSWKDAAKTAKKEGVAEAMLALEAELESLAEEGKASRKLCASSKPDNELGASQLSSCKSQGLRSRDGNKSHKLGKSPKSRVKVGGHKIKGQKYGGPLPDWS